MNFDFLTSSERAIIIDRLVGHTYSGIGIVNGMTGGKVRQIFLRALKKIHKELNEVERAKEPCIVPLIPKEEEHIEASR